MSKTTNRQPFGKRDTGRVRREERRAVRLAKSAFLASAGR